MIIKKRKKFLFCHHPPRLPHRPPPTNKPPSRYVHPICQRSMVPWISHIFPPLFELGQNFSTAWLIITWIFKKLISIDFKVYYDKIQLGSQTHDFLDIITWGKAKMSFQVKKKCRSISIKIVFQEIYYLLTMFIFIYIPLFIHDLSYLVMANNGV